MEESQRKMTKLEFWIRFGLWAAFAVVAPVVFIAVKYGIFTQEAAGSTGLSGWGILCIAIVAVFMLKLMSMAKKGLPYGSMLSQCMDGYMVLLPAVLVIFILELIKGNIEAFEQTMIFFVICEGIAIPINPMRKWADQNNIERTESLFTSIIKNAVGKK